jgi:transcriptional regulator with XRE-family HTH domain
VVRGERNDLMDHSDLESPLRVWRKAEGLTQESLAEQANVTQAHISHVENGESPIEGKLSEWLEGRAQEIIGLKNQQRAFMEKIKTHKKERGSE